MKQPITSWAEDDRPREKMMLKGKNALSDAEILAILIGSGTSNKSALELAQELLNSCDFDLAQFSRLSIEQLCNFKGVGVAKAITIQAALELGRRRKSNERKVKDKISSSKDAYDFCKPFMMDLQNEVFYVIFLNRANVIIKTEMISSGGYAATVVDTKLIFKKALEIAAQGIILVHNHPSGQLKPSEADISITKKIVQFSKLIEITVLDHLIYTDNGYFSFADDSLL